MLDDDIVAAAQELLDICRRKKLHASRPRNPAPAVCVAGTLTEIPGVSSMLDRGFVTYSNAAKQEMLGVPAAYAGRVMAPSAAKPQKRWRRARSPMRRSILRSRSPASPDRRRQRRESRSGSCISQPLRASGQLVHVEKRFGDPGRRKSANFGAAGLCDAARSCRRKKPRTRLGVIGAVLRP